MILESCKLKGWKLFKEKTLKCEEVYLGMFYKWNEWDCQGCKQWLSPKEHQETSLWLITTQSPEI